MKYSARHRDGVTIIEAKGKITIGEGDVALRESVEEATKAGATKVLIDLKETKTMDSSAIGELVSAFTSVKKLGGSLKLLHLPPKVEDILQITQLVTVFEVFEDEDEAIASFS